MSTVKASPWSEWGEANDELLSCWQTSPDGSEVSKHAKGNSNAGTWHRTGRHTVWWLTFWLVIQLTAVSAYFRHSVDYNWVGPISLNSLFQIPYNTLSSTASHSLFHLWEKHELRWTSPAFSKLVSELMFVTSYACKKTYLHFNAYYSSTRPTVPSSTHPASLWGLTSLKRYAQNTVLHLLPSPHASHIHKELPHAALKNQKPPTSKGPNKSTLVIWNPLLTLHGHYEECVFLLKPALPDADDSIPSLSSSFSFFFILVHFSQ